MMGIFGLGVGGAVSRSDLDSCPILSVLNFWLSLDNLAY